MNEDRRARARSNRPIDEALVEISARSPRSRQSMSSAVRDERVSAKAFMNSSQWTRRRISSMSVNTVDRYGRLWQSSWMKMMGVEAPRSPSRPGQDGRFKERNGGQLRSITSSSRIYRSAPHPARGRGGRGVCSPESEEKWRSSRASTSDACALELRNDPSEVWRETLNTAARTWFRGPGQLLNEIERATASAHR